MPCEIEFDETVISKILNRPKHEKNELLLFVDKLKALDKPNDRGGAYQKNLWAYPVAHNMALISRIDILARKIRIIDIIFNL